MAIHIQNDYACWLLREYAGRHKLGLTDALIVAVEKADPQMRDSIEALAQRIRPIVDEIKLKTSDNPQTSAKAKAILDEMWGNL